MGEQLVEPPLNRGLFCRVLGEDLAAEFRQRVAVALTLQRLERQEPVPAEGYL